MVGGFVVLTYLKNHAHVSCLKDHFATCIDPREDSGGLHSSDPVAQLGDRGLQFAERVVHMQILCCLPGRVLWD